jgi:hypothetical protein
MLQIPRPVLNQISNRIWIRPIGTDRIRIFSGINQDPVQSPFKNLDIMLNYIFQNKRFFNKIVKTDFCKEVGTV